MKRHPSEYNQTYRKHTSCYYCRELTLCYYIYRTYSIIVDLFYQAYSNVDLFYRAYSNVDLFTYFRAFWTYYCRVYFIGPRNVGPRIQEVVLLAPAQNLDGEWSMLWMILFRAKKLCKLICNWWTEKKLHTAEIWLTAIK